MVSKRLFAVLFLFLFIGIASAATINVPSDNATIQDAIDFANSGDTIIVNAGTYNENIVINKALTFIGDNKNSIINGSGGNAITINSNNVSIQGFTIRNFLGNGLFSQGRRNITIENNLFEKIGTNLTSGTSQAVYFSDGTQNSSNIKILNNEIINVGNSMGGSNKGIFIGDSTGDSYFVELVIENNSISDIYSNTTQNYSLGGRGAYGILVNHGTGTTGRTIDSQILNNNLSNIKGYWVHAIGLEGLTPDTLVQGNEITNLTTPDPTFSAGVFFEDNFFANTTTISENSFLLDSGFGVAMHPDLISTYPDLEIDVSQNYWGENPNFTSLVYGNVSYEPYLNSPPDITPDTPQIIIEENENGYVNDPVIKVILNALENIPDLFKLSIDENSWTSWTTWGNSTQSNSTINLTNSSLGGNSSEGNKIVYVEVKSYTNNTNSTHKSNSTILDTEIPYLTSANISGAYSNGTHYFISPENQDGNFDSLNLTLNASEEISNWVSLRVYNSSGDNVRQWTLSLEDESNSLIQFWNGTDSSENFLPDGGYTFEVNMEDYAENSNNADVGIKLIIDNSAPTISSVNKTPSPSYNNDSVTLNATIIEATSEISSIRIEGNWTGTLTNYSLSNNCDNNCSIIIDSSEFENQENVTWQYFAEDVLRNLNEGALNFFLIENRNPIFNGTIQNITGQEDVFSATINLSEYFYDLDEDELNYTNSIQDLSPGITSSSGEGIIVNIDNIEKTAEILSSDDWNGNATLIFTAEDFVGASVSSNEIFVTIEADENDPPVLGVDVATPINLSEDTTLSFTLNCDAPESNQDCENFRYDSGYSGYDENLSVTIDSSTGEFELSPSLNWYGLTYIRFEVDDNGEPSGTGIIDLGVNVTPVNDAPVLNVPKQEVEEDDSGFTISLLDYTNDVDNLDSEMIYNLISQSNQSLIDCSLNVDEIDCGNPASDWNGVSEIVLEVSDGDKNDTQQFIINITSVNDAPTISSTIPDQQTDEDTPFTINLNEYESDVDSYDTDNTLIWSVENFDESLISVTVEEENDLVIITPLENVNGDTDFDLVLKDSFNSTATQNIDLEINPVNDAPVLGLIENKTGTIGNLFTFEITAEDVDDAPSFSDDTNLFDIGASSGEISFTPSIGDSGNYEINISVTDGEYTDSKILNLEIIFENKIPVANDTSALTDEDEEVEINLICSDSDGDDLEFVIVDEPSDGDLDLDEDVATYKPDNNYNGADSFAYKCDDGLNQSNTATVDLTINSVNDAPEIDSISPEDNELVLREGFQEFKVEAEDVDSSLSYSWEVDGVSVGGNSNSYNYDLSSDGEYFISVEVTDGTEIITQEWTLTVSSYPVADSFSGSGTTDFSSISDLSSVENVVLENSDGKIEFLEPLDLSDVFDLDNTVEIDNGLVAIDSSVHPQLSVPARITITGASYSSVPEIFYTNQFTTDPDNVDGECEFCDLISYDDFPTTSGMVVFEVEHFSSFFVGGSGIQYNLEELSDLETCETGVRGNLVVSINDPDSNDDFGPGEEIEIEVEVENNNNDDRDIVVEAFLFNAEENDEVESDKSSTEEIKDGRDERFDLVLAVPEDFEDGDYIIFAKAYEKGDEDLQCNQEATNIDLEREDDALVISKINLDSGEGFIGGSLNFEVEVENIGADEQEDVYVRVRQTSLGISEESETFDIEEFGEDDRYSESLKVKIPEDVEPGNYKFEVGVVYGSDEAKEFIEYEVPNRTIKDEKTVGPIIVEEISEKSQKKSLTSKEILVRILAALIIGIIIELVVIFIVKKRKH